MFYERKARRAVLCHRRHRRHRVLEEGNTIGDRKREKIGEKDESVNY